ncbi:diguanylate cyclase [Candidatus Magnetominusculus dajiuhuensis]|uniref:GGDEF domain-containing response regulator n=1 Tax=Candidatus Magnetominusculus dajiuhuensis TaxID=3137712 RepID=UPI003B42F60F
MAHKTKKARVMIVEDEGVIAMDIKRTLMDFGYTVTSISSTAGEAIRRAQTDKADVVLMDVVLDGAMDGIEAATLIHSAMGTPVIFLTSYSDEFILERAKITEPFGYLIKPFRDRELYTTIEMALYKDKMQRQLSDSQKWFSTTLMSIGDGVITTNADGHVTFINKAAVRLIGLKEDAAIGLPIGELITLKDETSEDLSDDAFNPLIVAMAGDTTVSLTDFLLIANTGRAVPVSMTTAAIKDEQGSILGTAVTFQDQTKRKELEDKLRHMMLTDSMTELNNRRGFYMLAEHQLKRAKRFNRKIAMVFIDVDGLKRINDTLGHPTGDRAIVDTASILKETFRESDIIGRIGGDEFVVLITDVFGVTEDVVTERLASTAAIYNERQDCPYKISLSIGFVLYSPESDLTIDALMAAADRLMYEHKIRKHNKS